MRYFILLSYLGEGFHGWQSQPNAVSVQSTIENALSIVLRKEMQIVGAGRTDTGVNARTMYAHFDYDGDADPCSENVLRGLNRLVGKKISIIRIFPVRNDAHARFDALKRTYKYFISFSKTPFLYPLSWECSFALDMEKMQKAADALRYVDDFTSFAKLHSDARTNICKLYEAYFEPWNPVFTPDDNSGIVFTISADRFLRNMVRAVVGTLVDVGRGKITLEEFAEIIEAKDRCKAGTSMPPNALYLWDVEYPQEIFLKEENGIRQE